MPRTLFGQSDAEEQAIAVVRRDDSGARPLDDPFTEDEDDSPFTW